MHMTKSLVGQLLIANPSNPKDSLEGSVILIVTHNSDMTLGLQINRPMVDIDLRAVSEQIGVFLDVDDPIYFGGTLNNNKIHVIHSNDWTGLTSVKISKDLSLTNDLSVLAAIAANEGPEYFKACAGFWAWEPMQLENQLDNKNSKVKYRWELVKASSDLVFNTDLDHWHTAMQVAAKHKISSWF